MLVQKLMALGGYTRAEDLERDYPTMESFVEAFPQAQKYINQYKKEQGGNQQDPLMMVISAVADQIGIDPNQLAQLIQQSPEFMTQLSQLAAQDPNQAAKALMQVVQNAAGQGASGQGQMAQQEMAMAQPGEMPMNPEEAMQMAYGGANLKKFIRKTGGDTAFPQAAPMYDDNVYRTFPPNIPRLFGYGGMYQAPDNENSNETDNGQMMQVPSYPGMTTYDRGIVTPEGVYVPVESEGPVKPAAGPMRDAPATASAPGTATTSSLNNLKKNKVDPTGLTVSQIWQKVTGTPWSEAKKQGFTDGSYNQNIELRKMLLEGNVEKKKQTKSSDNKETKSSGTPGEKRKGRSEMVDNIDNRYVQTPNRYTAPTKEAMDLYEAGQNYIERNAANAPKNRYTAPTRSAMDLYEAGQNYIERNAAGAPRNRYTAPTKEAMDLYEAGQNYIERNVAPARQNVPFSYFSNEDTNRAFGRQFYGKRVYAYGGGIPHFQAPTTTAANEVMGPYDLQEVVIRPESQFGNGYYSPMGPRVGPVQEQYADLPWWAAAAMAGGAGGLYMGSPYFGSMVPGQNKVNVDALTAIKEQITEYEKLNKKSKDKKKMSAEEKTRLEDLKKKGFGAMASDMTAWSGVATPYYDKVLADYNKTNNKKIKTFGDLPADVREKASINAETLYYFQKNNPKAFKNMRNLANMYPNMDLTSAATEHMNKNAVQRLTRTSGKRLPRGAKAGLFGLGTMVAIMGIDAIIDAIRGPEMEEADIPVEQAPPATDTGAQMEEVQKENTTNWGLTPYDTGESTQDPYGEIEDERYGGASSYAYGGGTPFGYGYFPPVMYAGGTASPGIMDVDSELSNRNNTWLSYVRNNVQKAAMPESFKWGGSKKKKG